MEAEQLRRGALQEAAFYRAKVATLEGNAPTDLSRIEKDRVAELERQLGQLTAEHSNTKRELQRKFSSDESASVVASPRLDRDNDAIERAEEAEEAHRLAVQELVELQTKHSSVEQSLRELNERFITTSSSAQQREAELDQLRSHLQEAEATHDEHLAVIAQAQAAIASAGARTTQVEESHRQATQRITELEHELQEATQLAEGRLREVESATARLAEVEDSHAKSREEAESLRTVTTGRLGQLLESHKTRGVDQAKSTRGHQEQVRALEEEGSSLRKMLREAGQRVDAAESGVSNHRDRARELELALRSVKVEMRGHRSKLLGAQSELAKYKELQSSRDMELRDREMAVTEMETRVTVLRNLCRSFSSSFRRKAVEEFSRNLRQEDASEGRLRS
jgi:chromosome segregation ATPase